MVILSTKEYEDVVDYIKTLTNILPIDVEDEVLKKFPNIPNYTVMSIVSHYQRDNIMHLYRKVAGKAKKLLEEYEREAKHTKKHDILLQMAVRIKYSPTSLARILLKEKYKRDYTKSLLTNPDEINDPILSCNVNMCLLNDMCDGSIVNIVRRSVGEEYELRLKVKAKELGIKFYDENELRRTGFDKTPDLKLMIPILYKDKVIHWMESKAMFGSYTIHKKYLDEQLISYSNRFGVGIVIYWHGVQDKTVTCKENINYIIALDDFPKKEHIEFLDFDCIS